MASQVKSNFDVLKQHSEQLWRLGALAERYFAEDPNTCLLKLRQLAEALAQTLAARAGLYTDENETQLALLRRLQDGRVLPREIGQLFHQIRKDGNEANHALKGDHRTALQSLRLCWHVCVWFHRTFGDAAYQSGPFIPPAAPVDESTELRAELARLRQAVTDFQNDHAATASQLQIIQNQLSAVTEERSV